MLTRDRWCASAGKASVASAHQLVAQHSMPHDSSLAPHPVRWESLDLTQGECGESKCFYPSTARAAAGYSGYVVSPHTGRLNRWQRAWELSTALHASHGLRHVMLSPPQVKLAWQHWPQHWPLRQSMSLRFMLLTCPCLVLSPPQRLNITRGVAERLDTNITWEVPATHISRRFANSSSVLVQRTGNSARGLKPCARYQGSSG